MTRLAPSALELINPAHPFTSYESPTLVHEPAPGMRRSVEQGPWDWRSAFARRFRDDAISAVKRLTQDVVRRRVAAEEAASLLLPYLVKSSYAQRNLVCNALIEFATPQDLLFAALAVHERDRDPRVLQIAAELLEHDGAEATPVLTRLARSGRSECRYFVGTIINLPGLPEEQKREALRALARHPDVGTRQELLDEADRASARDAALVCRLLTHDADKNIRAAAGQRLAELEP